MSTTEISRCLHALNESLSDLNKGITLLQGTVPKYGASELVYLSEALVGIAQQLNCRHLSLCQAVHFERSLNERKNGGQEIRL